MRRLVLALTVIVSGCGGVTRSGVDYCTAAFEIGMTDHDIDVISAGLAAGLDIHNTRYLRLCNE